MPDTTTGLATARRTTRTYVVTREGWLHVAVIIALRTCQVLGYSLSDRMPDELVLNALHHACHREPARPGALFHSDRGSHYASDDFRENLGALVAHIGPNEFLVPGVRARVSFALVRPRRNEFIIFNRAVHGVYEDGVWKVMRLWSGDETDWDLNVTSVPQVLHVHLAT
jgi:hypothetical protein